LDDRLTNPEQVGAETDKNLRCHPLSLSHDPQEQVLGIDIAVAEL